MPGKGDGKRIGNMRIDIVREYRPESISQQDRQGGTGDGKDEGLLQVVPHDLLP